MSEGDEGETSKGDEGLDCDGVSESVD